MHQPVRDNLEEYLRGVNGKFKRALPELEEHLESCGECSSELLEFERQSEALMALRAPDALVPRSGFYSRVMQRIDEARASSSVWAAFLEPLFAKRVAFASAAAVLVLGAFLVSTQPGDQQGFSTTLSAHHAATVADDLDSGTSPQERDAVLVKLVNYEQ